MNGRNHNHREGAEDRDFLAHLAPLVSDRVGRRIRDLRVEVRGDGLILRGRTDSYHVKQLAQHAVMTMTDVPLVANRIEVAQEGHGSSRPEGTTWQPAGGPGA